MKNTVHFNQKGAKGEIYLSGKEIHYLYRPNEPITYLFDRELDFKAVQLMTTKVQCLLEQVLTINCLPLDMLMVEESGDIFYLRTDAIPVLFELRFTKNGTRIHFHVEDDTLALVAKGENIHLQMNETVFRTFVTTCLPKSKQRLRILCNESYQKKRPPID